MGKLALKLDTHGIPPKPIDRRPLSARGLIETYIGSARTEPLKRAEHMESLRALCILRTDDERQEDLDVVRQRLVESCMRRVTLAIRKLERKDSRIKKFPFEELVAVGTEALIEAVDGYSPDKKDDTGRTLSLIPYADVAIERRIKAFCRTNRTIVNIGRAAEKKAAEAREDPEKLAKILSDDKTAWTFAATHDAKRAKSVTEKVGKNKEREFGETIPECSDCGRADLKLILAARDRAVGGIESSLGKILDARELQILCLYHGVGCEKPLTFKEIGIELGISRAGVQKIYHGAITKVRKSGCSEIRQLRENWETAKEIM